MRKIWQTGLIAALLALLVPVVILTAAGAVRSAAPPEEPVEDCTGDTEEAEAPEENASDDTADESDDGLSGWDARQPVALEDHGTLRQLTLADYLAGVLMGEMLPSFEDAALEAQAVAARTFTLRQLASGKHDGYLCAEAACCQAWLSPEEAQSRLGEAYEARCGQLQARTRRPAAFAALTDRELEIVRLVAARLSNREIAEKLFLSEGSVKQYINQIYAKLFIDGDTRTKRRRLLELAGQQS